MIHSSVESSPSVQNFAMEHNSFLLYSPPLPNMTDGVVVTFATMHPLTDGNVSRWKFLWIFSQFFEISLCSWLDITWGYRVVSITLAIGFIVKKEKVKKISANFRFLIKAYIQSTWTFQFCKWNHPPTFYYILREGVIVTICNRVCFSGNCNLILW